MSVTEIDSITLKNGNGNASGKASARPESINPLPKAENRSNKHSRFYYTVGLFNFLLEAGIKAENLHGHTVNIVPHVPHVPEWCVGVVNVRGHIMPVVDMHVFLRTGISNNSNKNKKLLLLEHDNNSSIIFQIDDLPKVAFLDEYSRGKLPKKVPSWLIRHFKNEGNSLYEINHTDLLSNLKNSS